MPDIDYGQILEALNDKTDRDLGNLSAEGRVAGGLAFPSSSSIELTSPTNNSTYIAPSNGWWYVKGSNSGNNAWVSFIDVDCPALQQNFGIISGSWNLYFVFPARKGHTHRFTCSNIGTTALKFAYAEGSSN